METAMENPDVLKRLTLIRGELRAHVRGAENLTVKLIGHQPLSPESKQIEHHPSVRTLLTDISGLCRRLGGIQAEQHKILGDVEPKSGQDQDSAEA